MQDKSQKADILSVYVDENGKSYKTAGKIDYVAGWYFKAAEMMQNTFIRTAFVSTNSICQGEQVASVWKPLYERFGIHIDFAWRTFKWASESNEQAHVHVIIVGFSNNAVTDKFLMENDRKNAVVNISPYLLNTPVVFVESRKKPLCSVPEMTTGNRPADGGHLIIEAEDYEAFIKKEPAAKKYIKRLMGAVEYINNKKRYCLWLVGVSPAELRKMPEVMKRVELRREARLGGAPDRQKLADTPTLFRETKNPDNYIIIPVVSSEQRKYIPLGFMHSDVICTDRIKFLPDATLYEFGILTSNVHMEWMRTICGRLKSDYNYSKDIVYNNFPWIKVTEAQKKKIERTAQAILDARALYPDCSLADLYDELTMPPELRKAHVANDMAVMEAYGFFMEPTPEHPSKWYSPSETVAALMKKYQELTEKSNS